MGRFLFKSLLSVLVSGIARSYGNSIFNSSRSCNTFFLNSQYFIVHFLHPWFKGGLIQFRQRTDWEELPV